MAHSDLETITQLVEASEDRLSHEIEMLRAQLDLVSAHLGVPTSGYEISSSIRAASSLVVIGQNSRRVRCSHLVSGDLLKANVPLTAYRLTCRRPCSIVNALCRNVTPGSQRLLPKAQNTPQQIHFLKVGKKKLCQRIQNPGKAKALAHESLMPL